MTGGRARTRAIRARIAETGEPFTLAARNHDLEQPSAAEPGEKALDRLRRLAQEGGIAELLVSCHTPADTERGSE